MNRSQLRVQFGLLPFQVAPAGARDQLVHVNRRVATGALVATGLDGGALAVLPGQVGKLPE